MGEAALPLNLHTNADGFVWLTDANGYFVISASPIQLRALAEAIATAAEPAPWLGQPV